VYAKKTNVPSFRDHQDARRPGLVCNRNFVLLWCAYAVSAMGDHLSEMAILKTQNALDSSVDVTPLNARMSFMFFLPFFVLAPFAGLLADKLPRRMLMVCADLARFALMGCFAMLIGLTQGLGSWGPFLPLALIGLFAAVFSPARSALLPTLVRPEQLVRANGLISGLGIIATMAAAKLGGFLADNYDPLVAFRIDAATFLASAVFLMVMKPPRLHETAPTLSAKRSTAAELRAGLRYARAHRHVLELLAIASLVWFCGPLVNSVIPAVVRDVYHGSYEAMSNYRAFLGAGFILGAVTVALVGDSLRSELAITWGLVGISVGIAIFGSSVFLPMRPARLALIGAVGIVLAGMFAVAVMASFNSLLQRTVADRFRGRIFGVKDLCCTGALLCATGALGLPEFARVDRWVGYILFGVSALTLCAGGVTFVVRTRRSRLGSRLAAVENLNEFIAKFWWRLQRVGRPTVPLTGPAILVANHTCSADPLFLSAAVPYRPISFMVAAEFTNLPVARQFMRLIECIPVKRDGRDTAATKQAIRQLRAGNALGIFIEGRIVPPGEHAEPRDGAAVLALKTGAVVIPVHISGASPSNGILAGLLLRHRARVRFGRPVDMTEFLNSERSRDVIRAATDKIYTAILALAPAGEPEEVERSGPPSRESNPEEQQ